MHESIAQYEKYLIYEKRYSLNTASSYLKDIDQLISYLASLGVADPCAVTDKQLRLWLRHLVSNGTKPRSVNRKISSSKSYYKFLVKKSFLALSPAVSLQNLKTSKDLPVFIDEKSMAKLDEFDYGSGFEAIRNKLIIDLFYTSGVRLSELVGLERRNVDLNKCQIKVMGKRQKERIIPILDTVKSSIDQYLEHLPEVALTHDYLFVTASGDKIYPKLVYLIVRNYLNLATTAKKKSPHVLRHSFASHLLNNGADLNVIKEILGHASLAATQVYTHNSFEKLKATYKKSHPRE